MCCLAWLRSSSELRISAKIEPNGTDLHVDIIRANKRACQSIQLQNIRPAKLVKTPYSGHAFLLKGQRTRPGTVNYVRRSSGYVDNNFDGGTTILNGFMRFKGSVQREMAIIDHGYNLAFFHETGQRGQDLTMVRAPFT